MVDRSVPIRFGTGDRVPFASLSSTPAGTTPINHLKNEWSARLARWDDPSATIVIRGVLTKPGDADYVAIPGSNLGGDASVGAQLFSAANYTGLVADLPPQTLRGTTPLVDFRPGLLVRWLPSTVAYRSFEITISHSAAAAARAGDVRLRMLSIGTRVQMERNFRWGHGLRFLSDPEIEFTGGGSALEVRGQREMRRLALSLPLMTENDRKALKRLSRGLRGRPFIVSAMPERDGWELDDYSMLSRFGNAIELVGGFEGATSTDLVLLEV